MKTISHSLRLIALVSIFSFLACSTGISQKFAIASDEYVNLTEAYLNDLAQFNWQESYLFLADDVIFKMPDGDTDTRTVFNGIAQVKDFWNNYEKNSGNDKASFTDFVHMPVQVNEIIENVNVTGVFDLCYFSAELNFGNNKAQVRMHWAIHFNSDKKIDLINAYYDRTPIIAAANKNFLKNQNSNDMIVQIIRVKSPLLEEDLLEIAKERANQFRALPGLIQKYYIRIGEGEYGGVYVWDSKESMMAYKQSELAATIAKAYMATEAPQVEVNDLLFSLRN